MLLFIKKATENDKKNWVCLEEKCFFFFFDDVIGDFNILFCDGIS